MSKKDRVQVSCASCGKSKEIVRSQWREGKLFYCDVTCMTEWFDPNLKQFWGRVDVINGRVGGENRFYCSDGCKKSCPTYRTRVSARPSMKSTSREVQPELRQMVFARDNWECQICGTDDNLHCHHIEGIKQNPIESADLDNCITLCKTHHKFVHSNVGCRYFDLKCNSTFDTMHTKLLTI